MTGHQAKIKAAFGKVLSGLIRETAVLGIAVIVFLRFR